MRRRGFSLLEVMVAVTIFGAAVTIILAAQSGLVASNRTAGNMSQAIEIGRCRMSELEEKQLKLGFPEVEDKDSSNVCCDDKDVAGFSCEWKVERVKLPEQTQLGGDAGLSSVLGGGLGLSSSSGSGGLGSLPTSPSALGTVLSNPLGGAGLDFDAGLAGIGQTLQQSFGGGGTAGLLSMVFGLVYPSLKPMLEAGIRKVTVVIRWKEGAADRDFTLVQYITNPSRSGLLAGVAAAGGTDGGLPTNAGGATSPQNPLAPQNPMVPR
jgi:general secretion pathway protein I